MENKEVMILVIFICLPLSISINALLHGYVYHHNEIALPTVIHGVDGQDGTDGRDGIDGIDGVDGKDGIDGVNGTTPILEARPTAFGWYEYTELDGADRFDVEGFVINLGLEPCQNVVVRFTISVPDAFKILTTTVYWVEGQSIVPFTDAFYLDGTGDAVYFEAFVESWNEIDNE